MGKWCSWSSVCLACERFSSEFPTPQNLEASAVEWCLFWFFHSKERYSKRFFGPLHYIWLWHHITPTAIWIIVFYFIYFATVFPIGISPLRNTSCFPGKSQLRQIRAPQPTVHAWCFSVSRIHHTLIWTTGSLTCAQMFNACGYTRECTDTVRESALKVDWNKNLLLHWGIERHAGPTLVV